VLSLGKRGLYPQVGQMAYAEQRSGSRRVTLDATMLAGEWRRLRRAATAVALFTSPMFFVVLYDRMGLSIVWAIAATIGSVIAFRGLIDVLARRLLPWPSMYGVDREIAEEDVVARRRTWFWRRLYRLVAFIAIFLSAESSRSRATTPGGAA
jgi:hypothetical protein